MLGTRQPERIKIHSLKGAGASAEVRLKKARTRALDLLPVIEEIRSEGIVTLSGIAEELNKRGEEAPRGGQWASSQVWYALRHAEPAGADRMAA